MRIEWQQLNSVTYIFRIIAKGAGGGLGSGGVSSSRGAIVSSVIELHKDEEIYILVGQNGEHACIKSMGIQDESCSTEKTKHADLPKTNLVKDVHNYRKCSFVFIFTTCNICRFIIVWDHIGAGGGGGGSYVFLVSDLPAFILVCLLIFIFKLTAESSEQSSSFSRCWWWGWTWNWTLFR